MSWSDIEKANLNKEQQKEIAKTKEAAEVELNKKFSRIFSSDDGKVVLEHLYQMFVIKNETPFSSPNIEYEAGYHAGEAGIIKYITHRISNAKTR